ncbi:hypothetical protein H0H92_015123 [Tricholoma furcatifolium]|nr:hypothetical protein H0H92_015123 [Tricholoma furcatifolium]
MTSRYLHGFSAIGYSYLADGVAYDLMGLGQLLIQQTKFAAAKESFCQALKQFKACGDEIGQCTALYNLGHAVLLCSKPSDAEPYFLQALELSTRTEDLLGQTESLAGLSCTLLLRSRFLEAKEKIKRAISMWLPAENPDHLHILGRVNIALYNFDAATDVLRRAETLHLQMKDERGCSEDRLYLLRIDHFQGQILKDCNSPMEDNVASFSRTLDDRESKLVGPRGLSDSLLIGTIHLHTFDLHGGRYLIQNSHENRGEKGDLGSGFYHYQMGCFYLRYSYPDSLDRAESNFKQALRFHGEIENVQGQADDYNKLAEVFLRKGLLKEALAMIVSQSLRLHLEIGDIGGQADDLRLQACVFLEQSRLFEAEESIRRALELHIQSKMALGQGLVLATLSSVLWQQYLQQDAMPPVASPTDTCAEALHALERAADIFASFVADTELRQCQCQYRDMLEVKRDMQTTSKALLTSMRLYDVDGENFNLRDPHCKYRSPEDISLYLESIRVRGKGRRRRQASVLVMP